MTTGLWSAIMDTAIFLLLLVQWTVEYVKKKKE